MRPIYPNGTFDRFFDQVHRLKINTLRLQEIYKTFGGIVKEKVGLEDSLEKKPKQESANEQVQ